MEHYYTREIIKKLYKNKKYKQIVDLYSFVIKIDKNINIPIINRIYTKKYQILSLNAIYWNLSNPNKYYQICSKIHINYKDIKNFNINEIRTMLIENIYKQVIKKEIMMI